MENCAPNADTGLNHPYGMSDAVTRADHSTCDNGNQILGILSGHVLQATHCTAQKVNLHTGRRNQLHSVLQLLFGYLCPWQQNWLMRFGSTNQVVCNIFHVLQLITGYTVRYCADFRRQAHCILWWCYVMVCVVSNMWHSRGACFAESTWLLWMSRQILAAVSVSTATYKCRHIFFGGSKCFHQYSIPTIPPILGSTNALWNSRENLSNSLRVGHKLMLISFGKLHTFEARRGSYSS